MISSYSQGRKRTFSSGESCRLALPTAMSCLAWNCRELGNLRTEREVVEIVRAKDPTVVFLAKTLIVDARLEFVQSSIGFDHRWLYQE